MLMVVHLDQLAPYQGATQNKWPLEGSSWGVITVRTEPRGRKVRLITDVASIALRKEEMAVCHACRL
jgi:hypothetical protein